MKNENQNSVVDSAGNLSIFLTFFTLAWIIYLFPEVINNFFPITISKWLLVASAFSMTLFENNKDESKSLGLSDFGVGLGMVIIFIGFVNSFDGIIYKIIMLSFFAFFGCFGMYRGICTPIVEALFHNKQHLFAKTNSTETTIIKDYEPLSIKIFNIVLKIFELGAAVATILTFVGVAFE